MVSSGLHLLYYTQANHILGPPNTTDAAVADKKSSGSSTPIPRSRKVVILAISVGPIPLSFAWGALFRIVSVMKETTLRMRSVMLLGNG